MKTLVILFILFYQHQNVNAGFLNFFVSKMNEFTNVIKDAFEKVKNKVFHPHKYVNTDEDNILDITKRNVKQRFSNFLETMVAEVQTDSTHYSKVKFDPTTVLSTPKLAASHGRHIVPHIVYTKDGYILTVHHLLCKNTTKQTNQTVLMHHGLLGSSMDWILLGPEKSLPYILSDAGYDVWMANARGNYYSRAHIALQVDSPEFWNFSWHQMGIYDLPAVIDHMRREKPTNETISFVGHSMGATALLVLLSTIPLYNEYLRIGILLAPLAFMTETKGPLKTFSTLAEKSSGPVLNVIGQGEFLPSRRIPDRVASMYCYGLKMFCRNPLLFLSGSIPQDSKIKFDHYFIAKLLYHVPAGGSTKTILHYAQLTKTGKFHDFDQYSCEYPLSRVTLPIALFSSDEDWLSTVPDVFKIFMNIVNPIEHYIIRDKNIKHTDFVWGSDANELIFKKVLDFLDSGLKRNFTKLNEIDMKTNEVLAN